MKRLAVLVTSLCVLSVPAGAATLSVAQGDVLVNTGNGFIRGSQGQQLSPGDRVMVGNGGGSATIAYNLSCLENVRGGAVVTVRSGAPCGDQNSSLQPTQSTTGDNSGGLPPEGPSGLLIAGGVAVAVGVGIAIYLGTKSSSP